MFLPYRLSSAINFYEEEGRDVVVVAGCRPNYPSTVSTWLQGTSSAERRTFAERVDCGVFPSPPQPPRRLRRVGTAGDQPANRPRLQPAGHRPGALEREGAA